MVRHHCATLSSSCMPTRPTLPEIGPAAEHSNDLDYYQACAVGETVILLTTLSIPIEPPTKGRGGCSRMTASPTAVPGRPGLPGGSEAGPGPGPDPFLLQKRSLCDGRPLRLRRKALFFLAVNAVSWFIAFWGTVGSGGWDRPSVQSASIRKTVILLTLSLHPY